MVLRAPPEQTEGAGSPIGGDVETMNSFRKRAKALTGIDLRDIPEGKKEDLQGGHILCKRGEVWVVGVGYPDTYVDKDGEEYPVYIEFRRVTL